MTDIHEFLEKKPKGDRPLVKVERTRTEIRDDVAIRIYTELVMDTTSENGEFPDEETLTTLSHQALDAAFVFYNERFKDRRVQQKREVET